MYRKDTLFENWASDVKKNITRRQKNSSFWVRDNSGHGATFSDCRTWARNVIHWIRHRGHRRGIPHSMASNLGPPFMAQEVWEWPQDYGAHQSKHILPHSEAASPTDWRSSLLNVQLRCRRWGNARKGWSMFIKPGPLMWCFVPKQKDTRSKHQLVAINDSLEGLGLAVLTILSSARERHQEFHQAISHDYHLGTRDSWGPRTIRRTQEPPHWQGELILISRTV